jgi:opacity protein-like surface antigen
MAIKNIKATFCMVVLQVLLASGIPQQAVAQRVRAVQVQYGRLHHWDLPSGYKLRSISGGGFDVRLHVPLSTRLSLILEGGYFDTSIDQEDAVEQWNWPFWERFYGNYVRSLVGRDRNYAVDLNPKQHLYMIPVQLGMRFEYPLNPFRPFLIASAGVVFYERNLQLNEQWTKYFPEIDHRFKYEYDNHADVRKGEVFSARIGAGTEFILNNSFALTAELSYRYYQVRKSDRLFPLESSLGIRLGLVFYY